MQAFVSVAARKSGAACAALKWPAASRPCAPYISSNAKIRPDQWLWTMPTGMDHSVETHLRW